MFSTRHKLIVFVTVLVMFLSISIRPSFRARQHDGAPSLAKTLLDQAALFNAKLRAHPQAERAEEEYLGVIALYKSGLDADREQRYGDEALLAMARLAEEMAINLHKPRYYYSAIDYYSQLTRSYPQSPHRALALIATARISAQYLADKEEAERAYAEVVRQFPNSVSAREASANLARLLADKSRPSEEPLIISDDAANGEKAITSIRNFSGPDYARVVIDLSAPITYEKSLSGSSNLLLLMQGAKLAPQLAERNLAVNVTGMLKQIRAEAIPDGARLNLECGKIHNYAIFTLNNPYRLVIDLHGLSASEQVIGEQTAKTNSPPPPSKTQTARPNAGGSLSFLRALGLKVRRIVIDPGHGGHDTGALGSDGLVEKDLVLDIALRLRDLLKESLKDIDIVMTRDSDRFVALEERTAIANAQGADLFISIHANSSQTPGASGVETYYLSLNANKEELEVAARENASTARNARDLQTLLQQIVLDDKVIESRNFAQHVQRGLVSGLSRTGPEAANNRGVKKAPFIVLIGANMPSVLAEVSFISHPQQADALKTDKFRQQIAESLSDGIQRYIETLSKGSVSTAAGNN